MIHAHILLRRRSLSALAVAAVFIAVTAMFPGKAAAHLDNNLAGVPPSDPSEWSYHGIGAEESRRWIAEGIIFAAWAAQWRGQGFSAEAAGKWHGIANVYTAGDFLKNGFGPEEAAEWLKQGVRSGERARQYLSAGIDAGEAGTFWKKGLYPDEAKEWFHAGFDAEAMLQWRYGPRMSEFFFTKDSHYSRGVYNLEFAKKWRNAGFLPEEAHRAGAYGLELAEARKWKDAGFSFPETVRWRDSGFTPEEALTQREAGLSAADADLKRYESSVKEDEIAELNADITVRTDGALDVVEAVTVIDRPGGYYREGYYKHAPAAACARSGPGIKYSSPQLHVKWVDLDDRPGDHEIKNQLIHFKRNGAPLPEGEHRITAAYETDGVVLDEPHHDELCFVIISGVGKGNYIKKASAAIRLPKGAHVVFARGNAGFRDREDLVWETEETGEGDIVRYAVTRPLTQDMAFSVNVGFVKGHAEASLLHKLALLDRKSNRFVSSLLVFVAGLAISFIYYWIAWFNVGRDPKGPGAAAALFSPPGDIDPAGMRAFMGKGKRDNLSITAALLSLAERGYVRISESEGTYTIGQARTVFPELPDREKEFLTRLFEERTTVVLAGRREKERLARAARRMNILLKREYGKQTEQNKRFLWPGLVIAVLFITASLAVIDKRELFDHDRAGAVLAAYGALHAACYAALAFLFARLLRRPAKEHVQLLERLGAYAHFLRRSFIGLNARAYAFLPPLLQEHLPYAVAAGITVNGIMIRNGQAKWYKGDSGGFDCGDFITAVKRSL